MFKDGFEFLPLDVEQGQGFNGRGFVNCGDARHQIPNVANFLHGHGMLVLGHRQDPKPIGCVLTRRDGDDTREGFHTGRVDGFDAGVMVGRTKDLSDQLAGETNVIAVPCLTGHLGV